MDDVLTDLTSSCDDSFGVVSHQGIKRSAIVMIDKCIPIVKHILEEE